MLLGRLFILVAPTQVPSFFDLIHSFLHTCIQLAFIRKALGEQLLGARKCLHRAWWNGTGTGGLAGIGFWWISIDREIWGIFSKSGYLQDKTSHLSFKTFICPIPGTHCPRCFLIQLKTNKKLELFNRIALHCVFKTVICYTQTFKTQHNFCNHILAWLHFKSCQKFKINDLGPSGVLRGWATVLSRERGVRGKDTRREVSWAALP